MQERKYETSPVLRQILAKFNLQPSLCLWGKCPPFSYEYFSHRWSTAPSVPADLGNTQDIA